MTIDVEAPRTPRRGRATTVVVIAALIAAAGAGFLWWDAADSDEVTPDPSPSVTVDTGPTAEQETALVYYDWLRWRHVADCFTEAGYPREPYLQYELVRVPRVAAFLGVEAATDTPELPTPGYRWAAEQGPGGPDSPPARRLGEPGSPDSCLPDAPALQLPGGSTTEDLVFEARSDDAFLDTLAEYAWVAENPALEAIALAGVYDEFEPTDTDPAAQRRWSEQLASLTAAVDDQLVVVTTEVTDQYAQAAGVGRDGEAIIVRVSAEGADLVNTWPQNWDQSCGDFVISAGARGAFDPSSFDQFCNVGVAP